MDAASLHLILNHAPVFFVLSGIPLFLYGYWRKHSLLTYLGLGFFVLGAIFTLPVYFSGEETEEAVEHLPGVLESLIKDHEEMAERALFFMEALGVGSLITGFSLYYQWAAKRFLLPVIMLLSFVAGLFIVQTAHLGGQIRHTEIRAVVGAGKGEINTQGEANTQESKSGESHEENERDEAQESHHEGKDND
jgi:hypothetical protein